MAPQQQMFCKCLLRNIWNFHSGTLGTSDTFINSNLKLPWSVLVYKVPNKIYKETTNIHLQITFRCLSDSIVFQKLRLFKKKNCWNQIWLLAYWTQTFLRNSGPTLFVAMVWVKYFPIWLPNYRTQCFLYHHV